MMKRAIPFVFLLVWILAGCTVAEPASTPAPTMTPPPALPTVNPTASNPPPEPSPTLELRVTATALPTFTPPPEVDPLDVSPSDQSEGWSNLPVVSADGQILAFTSSGALDIDSTGARDALYVRDRAAGTTTSINRTLDGRASDFPIYGLALSGDGRLVAYYSHDGNLVEGDEMDCGIADDPVSCEDLFLHDRLSGETIRVPLGRGQGLGGDYTLALSHDGRLVAYGNTVLDWTNGQSETVPTVDDQPPGAFAPQFAANGRYLAFLSSATNLVPSDENEAYDVFVWDREAGLVERASVASDGAEANDISGALPFHEGIGDALTISEDGRFVAFASLATNLSDDPVNQCADYRGFERTCYNIYLHDRQSGQIQLITVGANGDSQDPSLSADGRFLVFASLATNLVDAELPECESPALINCGQIYLFDRETGQITLLSQNSEGQTGTQGSWRSKISADGLTVVFASQADNLVDGDTNQASDIFIYDLESSRLERASLKSNLLGDS
jgi:Tol biopolymer transport system component